MDIKKALDRVGSGKAINAINGTDTKKLYDALLKQAKKRTAIADAKLDEEGKTIKKDEVEELKKDEGVVMVESRAPQHAEPESARPASAGRASDDGDLVPLKAKKKSKKSRSSDQQNLF